jgi:hypothetical protein
MEGRMRKILIILAIALLPSVAMARGGHMGGGGHMGSWGGGHGSGGHWGGGRSLAMTGGRFGGWHAGNLHRGAFFRHGRFVHRHHRFFFAGAPVFAAYGYGYDCWRWVPTAWGVRRIWVCGDYY